MTAGNGRDRKEMMRRLRLADLRKLFRDRYGPILTDDDPGREDLHELLLPISVGPHPEIKMLKAIEVWAPWMQSDEATQLIDKINRTPIQQRKLTASQLGQRQSVTNEQRERLKLWTIAACDMSPEQMAEWRKAKDRARKRSIRQQDGAKPRAEYEAASKSRTKPWKKEGLSRAQWYRRQGAHQRQRRCRSQQGCQNEKHHERHQQNGGGCCPRP